MDHRHPAAFGGAATLIPTGTLLLSRWSGRKLAARLERLPGMQDMLRAISEAPDILLRRAGLVIRVLLWQAAAFLLDAVTPGAMLQPSASRHHFWSCFPLSCSPLWLPR